MRTILVILTVSILAISGCVNRQPPKAEMEDPRYSGFLGDNYRLLQDGDRTKGQYAGKVYQNPRADLKRYSTIKFDPVTVWRDQKSQEEGLSESRMQELADFFYTTVHDELSKDYKMVHSTGPRTLRLQIALTHAEGPNPVMDVVSTIVPIGRVISEGKNLGTGSGMFVGGAAVELKITDAETGELIIAAVDERFGTKGVSTMGQRSGDAKNIINWWSQLMRYRLCQERGRVGCPEPKKWF